MGGNQVTDYHPIDGISCLRPATAKLQLQVKKVLLSAHHLANSLLSQNRKNSGSIIQLCPLLYSHPLQILLLNDLLDPPGMLAARVYQLPFLELICAKRQPNSSSH